MRCYEFVEEHTESAGEFEWGAYVGWQEATTVELRKLEEAIDAAAAKSERDVRILQEVVRCVAERKSWEAEKDGAEREGPGTPLMTPEAGTRVMGWETPPRMDLGQAELGMGVEREDSEQEVRGGEQILRKSQDGRAARGLTSMFT